MIKNEKKRIQKLHLDNIAKISEIEGFPEIKHLLLFGSLAAGNATSLSDIDISYIADRPVTFTNELDLLSYLNRTIGTDEIDVTDFNKAPLPLQYKILSEGKVIFSINPIEIANLKEKIFPLYFDFKYYQNEFFEALKLQYQRA